MANILLVDDEESSRILIKRGFRGLDHQIYEADTAASALSHPNLGNSDIIITDYNMPGMNGAELITELRRMTDPRYFIGMSTTPDVESHFYQAGAHAFLEKDYDPYTQRFLAMLIATCSEDIS